MSEDSLQNSLRSTVMNVVTAVTYLLLTKWEYCPISPIKLLNVLLCLQRLTLAPAQQIFYMFVVKVLLVSLFFPCSIVM